MASRVARLTPQEWRVIALSIEGVPSSEACEALGIAPGTLESHRQAIRRKLAIPRGVRFESFVRDNFAEGVELPAEPEKREPRQVGAEVADRRVRWLLRITLEEVAEVAMAAGLRSQLLAQTVQRMAKDDEAEASSEVQDLEHISTELRALQKRILDDIRARGART
ncbi:MAG TPA: LuxR C-terminal-related transcriptional regulator [Actinomycetota bacterium]